MLEWRRVFLVSIIVPVYNKEAYLQGAVDSLIHQTYKNIEIILINDGSTDGSELLCEELARKHDVVHVYNQENRGVSEARSNGIAKATGEYILFLDADDYLALNALDTLVDTLERSYADICFCNFSPGFSPHTQNALASADCWAMDVSDFQEAFVFLWQVHVINNIGTKIYKRDCIADLRFTGYSICEDISFCIDAIMKSRRVAFIDKQLYYYREGTDSSLMSSYKVNYFEANSLLLEKLKKLRNFFSNTSGFDDEYQRFLLDSIKLLLINESSRSFGAFSAICRQILEHPEYRKVVSIEDKCPAIKDRIFFMLMKLRFYAVVYWYLRVAFRFDSTNQQIRTT